ncbi:hypothetical protein MPER_10197 [Moniliophthora perniciosa FA553]|nr:hypothetical protein MPER_10197 [Moniliophthora perniciosa FA553]
MGIQHIKVEHVHKRHAIHKRACDFYTAPKASTTHNVTEPLKITWDVNCIGADKNPDKLDIYLYAPGLNSSNPRIFRWDNVPFTAGSYDANLNPAWWDASNSTSSTVDLQLKAVAHGDLSLWMSSLPAAPVFKATYDPKTPISGSVAALGKGDNLDLDFKPEPESSKKGKVAAGVLLPLLFIAVGILAYMKWQRKRTAEKRKSFAQQIDKRMSTISVDWKSMSAAGAQAAIRASMAGDPRASMSIRPMSGASSFGSVNQAGFGAGGGYTTMQQPEMAQRTVGVGLRGSTFSNAERVSRVSFADSAHPRPRPSGESRRSAYERRSTAGQSRAFHQGFVPPLPNGGHGHTGSMSHLNVSTTTLSHYPEEDPEDAMSPKTETGGV